MTPTSRDGDQSVPTVGAGAPTLARYSIVRIEDDAVILYDDENERAWIQSGVSYDLEELR